MRVDLIAVRRMTSRNKSVPRPELVTVAFVETNCVVGRS